MSDPIPWPPFAYVPGQNARHPEDWFDAIKATAFEGPITDSQAWQVGLAYLEAGYFWECHEVLEAAWMALPNPSPERDICQAVIQLANARLKIKMGKPRAVLRLCDMVVDLVGAQRGSILGLDMRQILQWSEEARDTAQKMQ